MKMSTGEQKDVFTEEEKMKVNVEGSESEHRRKWKTLNSILKKVKRNTDQRAPSYATSKMASRPHTST